MIIIARLIAAAIALILLLAGLVVCAPFIQLMFR
jgi:hypothetical protein